MKWNVVLILAILVTHSLDRIMIYLQRAKDTCSYEMFNTNCFISYVYAAAAKTDSTQRAQTIKMDRTIRKINSSLVSSYMCGFRWRRVFVKCPWTSPTYAVFVCCVWYNVLSKTHCTLSLTHLLEHENAKNKHKHKKNQGCRIWYLNCFIGEKKHCRSCSGGTKPFFILSISIFI